MGRRLPASRTPHAIGPAQGSDPRGYADGCRARGVRARPGEHPLRHPPGGHARGVSRRAG